MLNNRDRTMKRVEYFSAFLEPLAYTCDRQPTCARHCALPEIHCLLYCSRECLYPRAWLTQLKRLVDCLLWSTWGILESFIYVTSIKKKTWPLRGQSLNLYHPHRGLKKQADARYGAKGRPGLTFRMLFNYLELYEPIDCLQSIVGLSFFWFIIHYFI